MLKKHVAVDANTEQTLAAALAARNRLIHRVLIDNVEKFLDPSSLTALVREVQALRRKVNQGDKAVRPFIMLFNEALGLDQQALEQEVRAALSNMRPQSS